MTADDFLPVQPHPVTGEPFVSGSVESRCEPTDIRHLPPTPPTRAIYEWDEDEYDAYAVHVRDLTDEEFAEAMAEYEIARAKWIETMGSTVVAGPRSTTGRFETASGSTAKGVQAEDGTWHWTDVDVSVGRQ